MSKFEFKNNNVELEINGQNFSVELTNDVLLSCDDISNEAKKVLEAFEKTDDAKDMLTQACDAMVKGIEDIIGVGAVAKIFGKKAITLFDLTDIIIFVRTEVNSALQKKMNSYAPKKKK